RYTTASKLRVFQCDRDIGSKIRAKIRFDSPAKITCHAVPLKASTSFECQRLESTEPSAQLNDPPSSANDHFSSRCPMLLVADRSGQSRTAMPITPTKSPTRPRLEIW